MDDKSKILYPSQIFIVLLIGLICGFFFAPELKLDLNQFIFLIFGLSIGLFFIYPNLWMRAFGIFLISIVLGSFYFHFWQSYQAQNNILELTGKEKEISGMIIEEIEFDKKHQKLILGYLEVNDKKYKGKILVYLPKYPKYKFGQNLEITSEIQKPPRFETFDWLKYLEKEKVYALVYKPQEIKIEKRKLTGLSAVYLDFKDSLLSIKNKFLKSANRILPEPESGLLAGILLGTKKAMPKDLLDIFNLVGITHIIALSGFNVTIIVKAFLFLSSNWPRKIAFALAIAGIITFIILTGASASVLRAGIMAGLILLAERLGRKADILIALLFAAILMATFNPMLIRYDVGFQLSFLATAGLIFFCTPISSQRQFILIPKFFREYFISTLAALSLALPVIVYYFGRFSLVAPIVNTLILPAIPLAMLFGFLAGIFGWVYLGFGQIIGIVAYLLLTYIIAIANFFASIPFAAIEVKNFGIGFLIIYYLVFAFLYFRLRNKKVKK